MPGLTSAEVEERKRNGLVNASESVTGRTYPEIVKDNVLTPFNIILFILGAVLFLLGNVISAVSATGVIAFNVLISTVQEMRAKRRLDKIALLTRPKVTALRDGVEIVIDQDDIVKDDCIILRSGDQALVDGVLLSTRNLEMDESVLTGESRTVRKSDGDMIYSGSICVSGEGIFTVTAFGNDSFANQMLSDAKKFVSKMTPLQMETGTITKILMVLAFLLMGISAVLELFRGHDLDETLEVLVIALDIVPIALFLLVTLTYMIAAVRMADSGVLLQNSNSVESLAHVDTVCMDKTGTVTTNRLVYDSAVFFVPENEASADISLFASATGSKNRTVQALLAQFGEAAAEADEEIQFSSERGFSAVRVGGRALFSGAWSSLSTHCDRRDEIESIISEQARKGLRTLVICRSDTESLYDGDEPVIGDLEPIAVVSIRDEVRPDCRETMQVFMDNGMDLKIISGDDPVTVDALFSIAGIPGERRIISGPELSSLSGEDFDRAAAECNIFGRMKPEQKEAVIRSLKHQGRYVAMIGDGVNDVRPIKAAHVGVALESGSSAARGVADMVLVDDRFAALPKALVEGRRTLSGMRDILKLYLTRNFALALMFIAIFLLIGRVPMIPIQNTFYAFVTVTIFAFFMTVFAKPDRSSELVLPSVLKFAIPCAITVAAFAIAGYWCTWYLVDAGTIIPDYEGMLQYVPDSIATTGEELREYLSWGSPSDKEIYARSAMVLIASFAGMFLMFLVCPRWRFLSYDGNTNRKILPMLLMLLVMGLVLAMMLFFQSIEIGLVGLVIFPDWYYGVILGFVAAWFVATLFFLKTNAFRKPVDRFEAYYLEKLEDIGEE